MIRRRETRAAALVWLSHVAVASLAVAGVVTTATGIVHACGGLDSHGYVAASRLFSEGRLRRELPDLSWLPFSSTSEAAAPLGFVPALDGASVVPEFPPGLPLVMALARRVAGGDAVFWLPWLASIALAIVIAAIARQRYGAAAARLAAVLTIAHPVVVAYAIQPMSDVPAALWTGLAVWAMAGTGRARPVVAGLAGSLALLTRPPLMLPMLVLGGAFLRRAPRTAITFGLCLLSGLLGLMFLQQTWYGSPLVSGHGGAGQLFTLDTLPHNLVAHGKWLLIVHTPLIVPLLWLGIRSDRWFGGLALAVFTATALPYMFYAVPFDDWEMVRFLLPGLAILLPVAAEGVVSALKRIPSATARELLLAGVALLVVAGSGQWLESKGVFRLGQQEAKYPRVGEWFATRTPETAIVLASLHSGSVHYYSGRLTLRWDVIPPDRLAAALEAARARGHLTYLVLDGNFEADQFDRVLALADRRIRVQPIDRVLSVQIAEIGTAPEPLP